MATPIGHALAGYAIFSAYQSTMRQNRLKLLGLCLVMAIAPDFDFLPGLLAGQPALYHQGISHSLGVAAVVSFGLTVMYRLRRGTIVADWSLFFFAYVSHLAVDLLGVDARPPYGIPVFWPFSNEAYLSPWQILLGVHHAASTSDSIGAWLLRVFHLVNLKAIGIEVLAILPIVLLIRNFSRLRLLTTQVEK
jgi:inner membrane protein